MQMPVGTSDAITPVQSFASSDNPAEIVAALNATLDPSCGKNLVIAVQTHATQAPTLTLVVHHLIADGVALALLGGDLQQTYASPGTQWPRSDDRYLTFAKQASTACDNLPSDQISAWGEHIAEPLRLPYSGEAETDTYRHEQSLQRQVALTSLSQKETQLHEHLAVGLYRAVAAWTEQHAPLLALRHHGRTGLAAEYHDVVGWFSCDIPLKLKLAADHNAMIEQFKQSYADLPAALSYTQAAITGQLPVLSSVAPIRFNYQPAGLGGQHGTTSLHQEASEEREYALDLIARVQSEQLLIIARFGRNHQPDEVAALLDRWLSHCQITASDGAKTHE
ncbi:MAG: condensation domain-containing protein, partial [Kangiellaceae bacterium]|jgi:hypothetical protein|nr:condensation domain-containing protein [Kangiellaceae bacterium]